MEPPPKGKITTQVAGSPYQPRDKVIVIDAIDIDIHDVSSYIGQKGVVEHLCFDDLGEYPGDPEIYVRFPNGDLEFFWAEELKLLRSPT